MVTVPAAAAAALDRLIDYAGLFPPARLELHAALDGYAAAAASAHAWMLGRFIAPLDAIAQIEGPVALSVIVPATEEAFVEACAARERGARIEALEIPPASPESCAQLRERYGFSDLPVYLEIPADAHAPALLDGCARVGLRAKVRCGGLVPEAFPSVEALGEFIVAAREHRVAFKATAGLHHPVRHFNAAAGVTMHGFLNLLAATVIARDPDEAARILADEDAQAFALDDELRWRERSAAAPEIEAARRERFIGYGSCSFDEPVNDLRALGILGR